MVFLRVREKEMSLPCRGKNQELGRSGEIQKGDAGCEARLWKSDAGGHQMIL